MYCNVETNIFSYLNATPPIERYFQLIISVFTEREEDTSVDNVPRDEMNDAELGPVDSYL